MSSRNFVCVLILSGLLTLAPVGRPVLGKTALPVRVEGAAHSVRDCAQEGQLRSAAGAAVTLHLRNLSNRPLKAYWLDYAGKRKFYFELSPWTSVVQPTFSGHPWLLADTQEHCQGIVVATGARPLPARPFPLAQQIGPVPAEAGLAPFYAKYLNPSGVPVLASARVKDQALLKAATLMQKLIGNRPDLLAALMRSEVRVGIIGTSEQTLEMPEYTDLDKTDPGTDWNSRARGLGPTSRRPLSSVGEENLLCNPADRYRGEDIFVHEFGHAIQMALETIDQGFKQRLNQAYQKALKAGRWKDTYAASNPEEYWAEGVQSWFDVNQTVAAIDGVHNLVNTRAELQAYDPDLAALLGQTFGKQPVMQLCR